MQQIEGHVEAGEHQGKAESDNAPRPGEEEQEGLMESVEEESGGSQEESDQS